MIEKLVRVLVSGKGAEFTKKMLFDDPPKGTFFQYDALAVEEASAVEDTLRRDRKGFDILIIMGDELLSDIGALNANALSLTFQVFDGDPTWELLRKPSAHCNPLGRAEVQDRTTFFMVIEEALFGLKNYVSPEENFSWAREQDPEQMACYAGQWISVSDGRVVHHNRYLCPILKAIGGLRGFTLFYVDYDGNVWWGVNNHAHLEDSPTT